MDLHQIIRNSKLVGVFGSDEDHCSPLAREVAYEVGVLLASYQAVTVTGGNGGVMAAVSEGASSKGGLVIGVLPSGDRNGANGHCSLYIPTGIGYARGQIMTNMVHGGIAIEGGLGTREEVGQMYWHEKPMVAIASTGGTAAEVAGRVLDKRNHVPVYSADSAEEAVELLMGLLQQV